MQTFSGSEGKIWTGGVGKHDAEENIWCVGERTQCYLHSLNIIKERKQKEYEMGGVCNTHEM
jgi:hypothetical protein